MSPASFRQSVTPFEPGARDVFTHGFAESPRSTAFFARRPAPSMTDGFDVFVHDVIAARTTAPCGSSYDTRPSVTGCVFARTPGGDFLEDGDPPSSIHSAIAA